jgi:hypothetical protein
MSLVGTLAVVDYLVAPSGIAARRGLGYKDSLVVHHIKCVPDLYTAAQGATALNRCINVHIFWQLGFGPGLPAWRGTPARDPGALRDTEDRTRLGIRIIVFGRGGLTLLWIVAVMLNAVGLGWGLSHLFRR